MDNFKNITEFEIIQVRNFRESAGVDFHSPKEAYITVDKPVKGWCDLMVAWDDEFGGYLPFQMGWFGYGTEAEALSVAFDNAVEQSLPLEYTTESGRYICM